MRSLRLLMVSPKDAPKSWEDLLQSKWKGKVGVTTATHHLAVGVSSALIPGTAYYQKAKGKQLIFMSKDQSEKVESLAKSYGKMIGIR